MAGADAYALAPSLLTCLAKREHATLFACGFLLRVPARRRLFSCHSDFPRQGQASAHAHAAPPVAPIAVPPVRAERLALVWPPWAVPTVAAVVASPVPGEQFAAERPPLARPRVAVAGAAARTVTVVPAVRRFHAAPVVVLPVPVAWLAAGRPRAAPRLVTVPAAVFGVVRAVLSFHAVQTFHAAPAAVQRAMAEQSAVERPELALRLVAVLAAARRVAHAVLPFHVVRPFRDAPLVVLPVRVAAWLATVHPGYSTLPGRCGHRIFRVRYRPGQWMRPAGEALSAALSVRGRPF